MDKNILLIGFGNMGSAFYKGLIQTIPKNHIFVCDRNSEKLSKIPKTNRSTDINTFIKKSDVIIFGVKPQSYKETIEQITEDVSKKTIISMMANVSMNELKKTTKSKKIIKTMPNLSIKINSGVIGWIKSDKINTVEEKFYKKVFSVFGEEIQVKKEIDLHKITVIAGSGPAYFFYLCELLEEKAKDLGFSSKESQTLARATFCGSSDLLQTENTSAKEWRKKVSSKGSITETATNSLVKNNFDKIFKEAINEAYIKAKGLNI